MTTPHSARRPEIEARLDKIGVTWRFDPDVALHTIDQAAGLANQVRHDPLDLETVDRYADAMRNGDQFPAVLLTDAKRPVPLGGNHRIAAHAKVDNATTPGYLVTGTARQLRRIRFEDNSAHGLPLTTDERIEHGLALMDDGMTQFEAAKAVGLAQPQLSIGGAALKANQRAADAGIDGFGRLPQSVRYQVSMLDDPDVFAAAARLTLDAGLTIKIVTQIVAGARAVEPVEALRFIGSEAEDYADRIRDRDGKVRAGGRSARAQLETALATIRSLAPQDVYASCSNTDIMDVLDQRINDAAKVLVNTRALLKQHRQ